MSPEIIIPFCRADPRQKITCNYRKIYSTLVVDTPENVRKGRTGKENEKEC